MNLWTIADLGGIPAWLKDAAAGSPRSPGSPALPAGLGQREGSQSRAAAGAVRSMGQGWRLPYRKGRRSSRGGDHPGERCKKADFSVCLWLKKTQKHWLDVKQLFKNFSKAKGTVKHKTKANLSMWLKYLIWSKMKNLVFLLNLYFLRTSSGIRWKSPQAS